MVIKQGEQVKVDHSRSGKWIGKATEDFDTENMKSEWYPLILDQDEPVQGLSTTWYKGDEMPARVSLCEISTAN